MGLTKRGKGSKIMAIGDAHSLPLAVRVAPAAPHEVTLVEDALAERFVSAAPDRLVGDRAYDSDPLDAELKERGIEMIAPRKESRVREKTRDGRPLRRYARRRTIERLFAWLQRFRRIVARREYRAENFLSFVQLGCAVILLRRCF